MSTVPSPFDRDALWGKAKNFINRSFEAHDDGDFAHAAMWAAFALELLGKSALSSRNPCLIADPNDDGLSLIIAAGLSDDHARAKSIQAKGVFSRCKRAFAPFSAERADRIAMARNEELHSGLMPFDAVQNQDRWWQRFWAQAVILIEAQDEDLDSFVGSKRTTTIQDLLDRDAEHVKQYTALRITEAVGRWEEADTPDGAAALERYLRRLPTFAMSFNGAATCPACSRQGSHVGEAVASSDVDFDPEDGSAWETVYVYPEAFECSHCGLVLDGQPYLDAAGLDNLIVVERDYEPVWDDYGND